MTRDPFELATDDLAPHRARVLAAMAVEVAKRALAEARREAELAEHELLVAGENVIQARERVVDWTDALENAVIDLAHARELDGTSEESRIE